MKKIFLILLIFTTFLQAYNYTLENGWQMVGAVEDIKKIEDFDNSCIKEVWRYDHLSSTWQSYILSDKNSSTLSHLNESDGFWVKTDSSCEVNPPEYISFYKEGRGYILNDYNQSKRFEIIDNQEKLDEFYSNYKSSEERVDIDFNRNLIVLLRNSGQTSYYGDINVKEVKKYLLYTEISIESKVVSDSCNIDTTSRAPFKFISIPRSSNTIIFNESVSLKSCSGEDVIENFKEISFREVDLKKSDIIYSPLGNILHGRLEVIQTLEVFEYLYKDYINPVGIYKELPNIDFDNESVLALFMGWYSTGPYDIKVTSVKEYDSYIKVEIEKSLVGYYCPVQESETSPAIFVAIPKTNKEIIFKEYPNIEICEDWTKEYE